MAARMSKKVKTRLNSGLRKYQKILVAAKDRDINESDTVVIITDFINEVLGFDKYSEITTEFAIRGTYCDLAVKVEGELEYLLEVKAVGISLKERHLRQALQYAGAQGIEWLVLTNGVHWHVYKVAFEKPIRHDLVFALDLPAVSPSDSEVLEKLFVLSKEGFRKSAIEAFQQKKDACSPLLIGAVIMSDSVIGHIRRELRRISPGAKIDEDEILDVVREEVLKRDVVEGEAARSASGRLRRAANRSLRKKGKMKAEDAAKLKGQSVSERPLPTPSAVPQ